MATPATPATAQAFYDLLVATSAAGGFPSASVTPPFNDGRRHAPGWSLYRGPFDRKSPAGLCIPDELWASRLEPEPISCLHDIVRTPAGLSRDDLRQVEELHDYCWNALSERGAKPWPHDEFVRRLGHFKFFTDCAVPPPAGVVTTPDRIVVGIHRPAYEALKAAVLTNPLAAAAAHEYVADLDKRFATPVPAADAEWIQTARDYFAPHSPGAPVATHIHDSDFVDAHAGGAWVRTWVWVPVRAKWPPPQASAAARKEGKSVPARVEPADPKTPEPLAEDSPWRELKVNGHARHVGRFPRGVVASVVFTNDSCRNWALDVGTVDPIGEMRVAVATGETAAAELKALAEAMYDYD